MKIHPKWASDPEDTWHCASCQELVNPDNAILEEHYGFEGEAWGHHFPAQSTILALSPCCRSFILNKFGNALRPNSSRNYP